MALPLDRAVLYTASVLLFGLRMNFAFTVQRIAKKIKSNYRVLSDHLRCQNAQWFWLYGASILSVIAGSIVYRNLTVWFLNGDYRKLKDAEITRLSGRLKFQMGLYAVLFVSLLVFAFFRIDS